MPVVMFCEKTSSEKDAYFVCRNVENTKKAIYILHLVIFMLHLQCGEYKT